MKSLLLTLGIFLLPFAAHAQSCTPGPPAYNCFVKDTAIHPYVLPIPSWGPNTCDSTSMYTMELCGNLTGAGTIRTPSDFGTPMARITDLNTNGNPLTTWQTADQPSIQLWNSDDTAMMILINGGGHYVFNFTPATMASSLLVTTPNAFFPSGSAWSHTQNNHIYSFDNTTGPGIYLYDNTVNLSTGAATKAQLFDFTNSQCLMNTVNGYPSDPSFTGGNFPLNEWNGDLTSSLDDTTFVMSFSLLGGQGSGYFQTVWTVGQTGCDLYNTKTGVVTHNGTLLGTIPDTQWGGAFGGKADRFGIHDSTVLNSGYVTLAGTQSNFFYGTYNVGDYIWQKGTTNVLHCGIGAPDWKGGHTYKDGDRILPIPTSTNPGGYIFQIVNGIGGMSSATASEPQWKSAASQTPGSNTVDNQVTWRNTGIGSAQTYACDGHQWKGNLGLAAGKQYTYHTYADPSIPLLAIGPANVSSAGDQHLGNTQANTTDTNWMFVISTDYGTTTNLLTGPLPSALYMEGFFVAPPYCTAGVLNTNGCTLGQVRRAFHAFSSGWHKSFDVQNNIAVVSQTGNFAMLATDGLGQFGNTSGGAKCNVGGPKWNSNDSTDYPPGTIIYPILSNDADACLYKVQSCAGYPTTPCTTGGTQPNWSTHRCRATDPGFTVAGMGTFVDGTITWQAAPDVNTPANTAIQNCRADVMVVKLNGGGVVVPGPTPASTTIMFTKNADSEMDRIDGIGKFGGYK